MTPRSQRWEEEFAILAGSSGAYRGEDVRRMSPEKRKWTLQRLRDWQKANTRGRRDAPTGPTMRGRPIG